MAGRGIAVHAGQMFGNELLDLDGREIIYSNLYAHESVPDNR